MISINYKETDSFNDNQPAVNAIVGYILSMEKEPTTKEELIESYTNRNDIIVEGSPAYFDSRWGNWLPGDDGEDGFISKDDWKSYQKFIPKIMDEMVEDNILIKTDEKYLLNENLVNVPEDIDEMFDLVNEYYANYMDFEYDPY